MDAKLHRALDAIARDNRSGAAHLAARAVKALLSWLRRHPEPGESELLEIARALLKTQPSMAPMLRLANEIALAVDNHDGQHSLAASLRKFERVLRTAPQAIAEELSDALRRTRHGRGPHWFATYSYSSTVVNALTHARSKVRIVYCSEGRPGYEGRKTAQKLAAARIQVCLKSDAALLSMALFFRFTVVGADSIWQDGFINKVGTKVLVKRAREMRRRGFFADVWVLTDTTKFWPESWEGPTQFWRPEKENPKTLWQNAPKSVWVSNPAFEFVHYFPGVRLLTEKGWMTPAQVRRELKKIRISPRLKSLVD